MPSTSSRATSALAWMDGTMTKELKSVRTTLMLDVPVWAFATKLSVNRGSFPSLSSSSLLLSLYASLTPVVAATIAEVATPLAAVLPLALAAAAAAAACPPPFFATCLASRSGAMRWR